MFPPKVMKIAKAVRRWAERYAKKYNFNSNLMGLCGIASSLLLKKLREAGYSNFRIVSGNHHAYLVNEDEVVLDCTATQFGYSELVLVRPKAQLNLWKEFYYTYTCYDDETEFVKYQLESKWPKSQIASWIIKEEVKP
jgi:hypothetical protein